MARDREILREWLLLNGAEIGAFQTFTETPAETPSILGFGITHQPHLYLAATNPGFPQHIATAWPNAGVDVMFGIGGTPEGVVAAAAFFPPMI